MIGGKIVVTFYEVPISKDYLKIVFKEKLLLLTVWDDDFKEDFDGENMSFFSLLSTQERVLEEYIDLRIIGTEHRFFVVMGQEFKIFNFRRKHISSEKSGLLEDKPDEKEIEKYNILMKELGLKPEKVRPVVFVTDSKVDFYMKEMENRDDKKDF